MYEKYVVSKFKILAASVTHCELYRALDKGKISKKKVGNV